MIPLLATSASAIVVFPKTRLIEKLKFWNNPKAAVRNMIIAMHMADVMTCLPWSTWARIQIFLMFFGFFWSSERCWGVVVLMISAVVITKEKYHRIFKAIHPTFFVNMLWCNLEPANHQRLFTKSMSSGYSFQSPYRATCTVILSKWWVNFYFFYIVFLSSFL